MKSMTGYGSGENSDQNPRFRIEISSVNRKQLEVAAQLPKGLTDLEPLVREVVSKHLHRGKINVTVAYTAPPPPEVIVDEALAARVATAMRQMQSKLKLPGEVTLESILRAPGVVRAIEPGAPKNVDKAITKALIEAIGNLQRMREREGAHLAIEIARLLRLLKTSTKKLVAHAPKVAERLGKNLRARIKKQDIALDMHDDRFLREIALFAEKSDITEELTRIQSHLVQCEELLKAQKPVGRTIEFILQELSREFNTVGAKASDVDIARLAVESKSILEKIREQIANVE